MLTTDLSPCHAVITGGDDRQITFLSSSSGSILHRTAHRGKLFSLCQLGPRMFAASSYDPYITLYSYSGHSPAAVGPVESASSASAPPPPSSSSEGVSLTDDSSSPSIVVEKLSVIEGHTDDTKGLVWDGISNVLISSSMDNTVRIWRIDVDKPTISTSCLANLAFHSSSVYTVQVLPQLLPRVVFSGSYDHSVRMCDWSRSICLRSATEHANDVESLTVDPTRCVLFSGGDDGFVLRWDARSLECLDKIEVGNRIDAVCYRCLKNTLIVGSHDGEIQLYDVRNMSGTSGGSSILKKFSGHEPGSMFNVDDMMNPDLFVTASWGDESTKAFDENGKCVWSFRSRSDMTAVCCLFDPFAAAYSVRYGVQLKQESAELFMDDEQVNRLDFLLENADSILDFRLLVGESVLVCPKAFLVDSVIPRLSEVSEFALPGEYGPIDPKAFLALLLGYPQFIVPDELCDLFAVFWELRLLKHAYLICRIVESLDDIRIVLKLLQPAITRFETELRSAPPSPWEIVGDASPDDSDDVADLASPFSLACFNMLRSRLDEIQESRGLRKICEWMRILVRLLDHNLTPIHLHPEFVSDDFPKSWLELSRGILAILYGDKVFSDVRLRCADRTMVAHLSILVLKTNFAYRMLHFAGSESGQIKESGQIDIEVLDADALRQFLSFVYIGEITSASFGCLLPLLQFAEMFEEIGLRDYVFLMIRELTESLFVSGTFEASLAPYAYILRTPEPFREVTKMWIMTRALSQERLTDLIQQSVAEYQAADHQAAVKVAIGDLKAESSDLTERMTTMERRMQVVEESVEEIRRLLRGLYAAAAIPEESVRDDEELKTV